MVESYALTFGLGRSLRGLPVHGPLHGFLPSSEAGLALCRGGTRAKWDYAAHADKTSTGNRVARPVLTLRIDLRLVRRGHAGWQVGGAQVPHIHPLGGAGCHGGTQSRGLRHDGFHWEEDDQTEDSKQQMLKQR